MTSALIALPPWHQARSAGTVLDCICARVQFAVAQPVKTLN